MELLCSCVVVLTVDKGMWDKVLGIRGQGFVCVAK